MTRRTLGRLVAGEGNRILTIGFRHRWPRRIQSKPESRSCGGIRMGCPDRFRGGRDHGGGVGGANILCIVNKLLHRSCSARGSIDCVCVGRLTVGRQRCGIQFSPTLDGSIWRFGVRGGRFGMPGRREGLTLRCDHALTLRCSLGNHVSRSGGDRRGLRSTWDWGLVGRRRPRGLQRRRLLRIGSRQLV